MRLRNGIAILVCALVGIAGCTGRQPLNVNSPVVTSKGTPSEDEVRKALVTAASVTHWAATPLSSGWIVAERRTDGHSATVNIYYSAQHYSIALADTTMVDRPQAVNGSNARRRRTAARGNGGGGVGARLGQEPPSPACGGLVGKPRTDGWHASRERDGHPKAAGD